MIEARSFTNEQIAAIGNKDVPPLAKVLWYAAWYLFWAFATLLVIVICTS